MKTSLLVLTLLITLSLASRHRFIKTRSTKEESTQQEGRPSLEVRLDAWSNYFVSSILHFFGQYEEQQIKKEDYFQYLGPDFEDLILSCIYEPQGQGCPEFATIIDYVQDKEVLQRMDVTLE